LRCNPYYSSPKRSRGTVSISLLPEMKISVVYTALVEKDGKKKVTIIVVT